MDLLNKLTIKSLKLNKKRTIVTIIGIILSVALITAVASMFFSARSSLIEFEIREKGNYHYGFCNVPVQNMDEFEENRKIELISLVQELGYDYLEGSKNEYKPYINVKAFDKNAMENLAVNLVEGRLPENENEILVPSHTKTNGGVIFNIGEKLELNIGTRVIDGYEANQNNPYDPGGNEEIIDTIKHTYTIVGIIERPSNNVEDYSAPGYTFITYMDKENINTENVDAYVRYTKDGLKDYLKVTANILGVDEDLYKEIYGPERFKLNKEKRSELISELGEGKYLVNSNDYLITLETGIAGDSTLQALGTAVLIVIVIIIVTSVFCIKNSFDISITEKTKQYGMLSSIGATKKQIKRNVYYEALILGLIGMPLGILFGEFAAYILIIISNYFLKDSLNLELIFSFSWLSIIFAILLAFVTIYLSARKSAKKASKIAPITAIRNSENIKIKSKKIKSPKIINKIFGVGGEIAYKNLKRNKKKYRTTVISIIVCVSVFIALSSFMNLAFDMIKVEYGDKDYNIYLSYRVTENIIEKLNEIGKLDSVKNYSVISYCGMNVSTDKYSKEYLELHPDGVDNYITINSINTEEFKRYTQKLGLDYNEVKDKGILINNFYDTKEDKDGNHIQVEIPKYTFKVGDTIKGTVNRYKDNHYEEETHKIEIAKITKKAPMGISEYRIEAALIVDEKLGITASNYDTMYIDSFDGDKTQEEIEEILKDEEYTLNNMAENAEMMNSFYTLIAIFLYGFIIVIALIGITNIFNTITTNMKLRSREFAMLQSIGMTKKEFNRMIRLESFFYGTRSLIIGIPIGCVLSYMIYKALMSGSLIMRYKLPIIAIIISVLAVFILITTIMKYSISKINKQNIIDTIRNDNI